MDTMAIQDRGPAEVVMIVTNFANTTPHIQI